MARRTWNRLMATAVGGAVLVAVIVVAVQGTASSTPTLPIVAPDRLVASIVQALERPSPVSGRVTSHVDLGLPQLSDEGAGGATGTSTLLSAISGDHTIRLWRSQDGARINELLPFGERSITVSRTDAWAWDSTSFTAYHLGPYSAPGEQAMQSNPASLIDPLELARRSLAAITPSTVVSVARAVRVAGRDAYTLVLQPRTPATLVGRVEVSIDAGTRLPLRVAVFARGARSAALSAGFTSVSFDPISPAVYRFSPPPGAHVVNRSVPKLSDGQRGAERGEQYAGFPGGIEDVRNFGRDWATVVAVRVPSIPKNLSGQTGVDLGSVLPYSGPLFSIRLVTRAGHDWVLVGAVPQASLAAVEPELS